MSEPDSRSTRGRVCSPDRLAWQSQLIGLQLRATGKRCLDSVLSLNCRVLGQPHT